MELKGVRPGRFGPKCQKCGEKFVLIISSDPSVAPVVQKPRTETVSPAIAIGLGIQPPHRPSVPPGAAHAGHVAHPAPVADLAPATVAVPVEPAVAIAAPVETMAPAAAANPPGVATMPPAVATMPPPAATIPPYSEPGLESAGVEIRSGALAAAIREAERAIEDAEEPPPHPAPAAIHQTVAPAPAASILHDKHGAALPDPALLDIEKQGKLGGYEIVRKLGQGGMGAVYLARQVSLDRDVAVKVLAPEFARDASFIARFTREAFAAAQLTHHNIVQIHDLGEEHDIHYFSMEFVEGQTLGQCVKKNGRLDAEAAVGYALQAARGLKFAHDHAMIHRDIKPDNLLLNDSGLVKVADLGLVKRYGASEITAPAALSKASDASVTSANLSMGTPAYMAPEQAKDAAKVDARADIYSLGCTLYDMLTGRPPFLGKTAVEVITKHTVEPVTPPEKIVKDVPPTLSSILLKMMAKKPEERYASMDDVIHALEGYLGEKSGSGPFAPREEHAKALERLVNQFNRAALALPRRVLTAGFFGLCALAMLFFLWRATSSDDAAGYIQAAGGAIGLGVLTLGSYIILTGSLRRTYLLRRLRQYVFGARWMDWARAALALGVFLGLLLLFHLQWVWLGLLIAAVLISAAFYFAIDIVLARQRAGALEQMDMMLRQMRMRGLDEDALRQFICKYSGNQWEEFYEAIFGYEDKLVARQRWGVGARGRGRKKWGAWRDALIAWIDEKMRVRDEEARLELLAKVEERKMRAEGVQQAKAKARRLATNVVAKADRMRESIRETAMRPQSLSGQPSVTVVRPSILDDSPTDEEIVHRKHESYLQRKYGSIWGLLLGAQLRFLVGLGILAGFLLWMYMSNPDFLHNLAKKGAQESSQAIDKASGEDKYQTEPQPQVDVNLVTPTKPLEIPHNPVPLRFSEKILAIIGSYQGGLAGALLVISALFRGVKMTFYMVAACTLILLCGGDHRLIPLPIHNPHLNADYIAMILGSGIAVFAFLFGRDR
jgi:hypothetical protein